MNLTKYLKFDRTSSRSEYWATLILTWVLVFFIWGISFVFIALDGLMVLFGGIFMLASSILLLWITLAITANRCRDAGLIPWWAASLLLPYIGFVTMIVFGCLPTSTKEKIEE